MLPSTDDRNVRRIKQDQETEEFRYTKERIIPFESSAARKYYSRVGSEMSKGFYP
jgi:hypothetical protein